MLFIDPYGQIRADARAALAGDAAALFGVVGRIVAGLGEFIGSFNALFWAYLYAEIAAFTSENINFHFWHYILLGQLLRRGRTGARRGFLVKA